MHSVFGKAIPTRNGDNEGPVTITNPVLAGASPPERVIRVPLHTLISMPLSPDLLPLLAALPLRNLSREYPNHLAHLMNGPADARSPRELHPVFYGCFDWHSAVHGYWLLARVLASQPEDALRSRVEAVFDSHFNAASFERETDYFAAPGRASFERPYGWAWLLALAQALKELDHPRAKSWKDVMQALVVGIRTRMLAYLPKLDYPIRAGTHANTAFALILAGDYARSVTDGELTDQIVSATLRYFSADTDYPVRFEPSGDDFLSGGLTQAVAISRVLDASTYGTWFDAFLPHFTSTDTVLKPARVSDHSDPKTSHLDGLNLSRAWCMKQIAAQLPANHAVRPALFESAAAHIDAALPHVASGAYEGEHWLATFAMLALE